MFINSNLAKCKSYIQWCEIKNKTILTSNLTTQSLILAENFKNSEYAFKKLK